MKSSRPWYTDPRVHVAVILLVAGWFRLWQIDSIPPGLFGDEATNGLDALDILAGRGAIFFPANFGREGLHMWLIAAMFRLLGVVPLALRLPSALAGIFTALATYWLGRELLAAKDSESILSGAGVGAPTQSKDATLPKGHAAPSTPDAGPLPGASAQGAPNRLTSAAGPWDLLPLVAALYLATSFWHVHFSRFGIRGVFTPLFGALAFAAFWRGTNRNARGWFVISGACLGLAAHFYTAGRFLPFFLGGFLVVQWLAALIARRPREALLSRRLTGIVLLFVVAALVFAPLGIYFLQHPGSFTQRASEVTAFGADNPWLRMGRAAAANVIQFFVPGSGDADQFYNLPRRAVFDPLTAILALLGLGLLIRRWRQGPALFLLLWLPALLLPSFLATDRWPTLPRVLGVIPAIYFLPALGLVALTRLVTRAASSGMSGIEASAGQVARASNRLKARFRIAALVLIIAALGVHAALTYRDYFRVWGPSAATFDAFEGDMTAAWQWLADHPSTEHVYLSSDIYRHPTFMLLHERATVQTYFQHSNPGLSWFDARQALPLPPPGEPATYLIAASSPLASEAAKLLAPYARQIGSVEAPDGQPALIVQEVTGAGEADLMAASRTPPVSFTSSLALGNATLKQTDAGAYELWLEWRTTGPDPEAWRAYQLEIAPSADGAENQWQVTQPFEAFRPTEWVDGGRFITWHPLKGWEGAPPALLRLRLIDQRDGLPAATPDSPDGWHEITVVQKTSQPSP